MELVTTPGNRKRKLTLGRSRADEKEMESEDTSDIQAEEVQSAQGRDAGQADTSSVVGVTTRASKAALAATALATPSQDPPPRSEQEASSRA
jgi:hypothetical protein